VIEIFPIDALRLCELCLAVDDLIRRYDEVNRNVVRLEREPVGDYLERVNGGDDRCVRSDNPDLKRYRVFEIRVTSALSKTRAVAANRDRTAKDQIDRFHLRHCDLPAEFKRALDARGVINILSKFRGIELNEALLLSQPWHRHIDGLALFQREVTNRALRGVGIRLDEARGLPDFKLGNVAGALLRSGEVWYSTSRAGKASHVLRLEQFPDSLSDFLFGHR